MTDHPRPENIRLQLDDLSRRSDQLRQQDRLEQAIKVATQALQLARRHFGAVDLNVAQCMTDLASLYNETRDYAAAESLLREALKIWRVKLGNQRPETVSCLNILAQVYLSMSNYAAAAANLREVIDILRGLGITEDSYLADRLTDLGLAYYAMDIVHAKQAVPLLREALEIRRRVLGGEDPKIVASLNNRAFLHRSLGNYAEAEPLFSEVVDLQRRMRGERDPEVATALTNQAELYQLMGQYVAAEQLVEEALTIYRSAFGQDHALVATALNNLGFLDYLMGSYGPAEQRYKQALEITRGLSEQDHPAIATFLNNLAELYKAMGDLARAEPLSREGLEIRRRVLGSKHPETAQSVNNLAALLRAMGDYAAAEPLFQQALEMRRAIFGEEHPDVADSLNNLGTVYTLMGNYAAAEPLLRLGLEVRRSVFGDEHPDVADSLNNLAYLYSSLGQYSAAEPLFRQCLDLHRRILGEEHPRSAAALSSLAAVIQLRGNYAEAEPLQRAALETSRKILAQNHPQVGRILSNLAVLCAATDREREAVSLLEQATSIEDQMMAQIFSIGSESQRMAYLRTLESSFGAFLSLIVRYFAAATVARGAAMDLVLRRKALGAEVLAVQRDAVLSGRYPALESKLRALRALRVQIGQKTLAGPGAEGPAVYRQRLTEWGVSRATLETELARRIPEMNLTLALGGADRRAVSQRLPPDSALVEFIRFDVFDFKAVPAQGQASWQPARYLAFVLRAGEPDDVHMVDLGDAERIDHLIAAFRATVTGERSSRGARDIVPAETPSRIATPAVDGADLRAILFDPLVVELDERTRVILAPDGDLTRLPFEALPMSDGRRLIDAYELSYVSVGRDVLRFGVGSSVQPSDPLVAADPDFDLVGGEAPSAETAAPPPGCLSRDLDRSTVHFGRLPGTRLEGERIAELLGAELFMGASAVERRVKGRRSPSTLHLATHGFFLADQPHDLNMMPSLALTGETADKQLGRLVGQRLENPLLRSGLALAGANTWLRDGVLADEAEDGLLTAEDVSGLDLLSTDLVVLSACETGLGEVRSGEGVFGLRRAFVLAGAKTLVMSLWKVDDERTRELMEDFYARLLQHEPRAQALRRAQLAVKVQYPEPYNWGAFICQGDPSPLPKPHRTTGRG
jgi:CHAT domain-containing protein/tetratricopeptide (TPR) repeat protein